jgi:hypothetical protein
MAQDFYGPDVLKVLQQISDGIWVQYVELGRARPDDHEFRAEISRLVFQFGEDDPLDMQGIREKVIDALRSQSLSGRPAKE